jgi:MFS family permease
MTSPPTPTSATPAQPPAGTPAQPAAGAFAWKFVTPLFLGSALNPVNSSLIATALVPIAHALDVPVGRTAILVSALYLASAIAQPTAGKLAEEFGPRRVFLAGIVLVLLGGVLGGVADSLNTLVVARVLIGVGTSAGYPSAMLLIRRRAAAAGMGAPPGGVLGGLAIAGMATIAVGPPIGGLLIGAMSWRAAFLVNIPLAVIALALTLSWLPRDAAATAKRNAREVAARIDVVGIVGFGGAMTALLVFLMALPHLDGIALTVALVLAVALIGWERRVPAPFFDVRQLVANGPLTRTYIRTALTLLGVYTMMYGLTQWLQAARGMSSMEAGLFLLPMGVLSAVVSRPISRRNLVRGPLVAAAVTMLVASVGILFLTTHSPVVLIVGVSLVFGVTVGTQSVGNQTALYTQAPGDQLGTASGLFRTFSYLGSIGSATITSIVFKDDVTDGGLHTAAIVLIAAGVLALALTLFDRKLRTPARPQEPPTGPSQHLGSTSTPFSKR